MDIAAIKRACLDEIERAYLIVEEKYGTSIPRVPVEFSNRLTKCAGRASYKKLCGEWKPVRIKLSVPLIRLNPEQFVIDTPAHEAMHVAQLVLFGYADSQIAGGHGANWRGLMKLVDRGEGRYHSMKTVDNRVNAYCKCDTPLRISKQRAGKIRKKTALYACRRCHSALALRPQRKPEPLPVRKVAAPRAEPRGMWTPPPKPAPEPVKKHPVVNTKTGVNAVVAMIAVFKKRGMDLTTVLDNAKVLSAMAAQAQVTGAECRSMVKHNWSRV